MQHVEKNIQFFFLLFWGFLWFYFVFMATDVLKKSPTDNPLNLISIMQDSQQPHWQNGTQLFHPSKVCQYKEKFHEMQ